ncbi:COG2706 3-carboxymuconate cyclase [Burkholderiaceae bacterium]
MAITSLYGAVGTTLTQYQIGFSDGTLTPLSHIALPSDVQYCVKHPTKALLYAACSDGGPGKTGTKNFICNLIIQADGSLKQQPESITLPSRPIHISVDRHAQHLLVAYNAPSDVSVHRLKKDGSIGENIKQNSFELGACAHQIVVTPDNHSVVLPVRGNDPEHGNPELPGSLEIFDYADGILTHRQKLIPNAGYEFGPRHVDFHPTKPWMYLSIERQNQIAFFELGKTVVGPLWRKTTLAQPELLKPRQLVGAIHVHPNGKFVYVSNRADGTIDHNGTKIFNAAENTISTFSIHAHTGEPTLIHTEDTRGMHVRTFSIDPSGTMLIAGCMIARDALVNGAIQHVPGGLSVFRIQDDGTLRFLQKYDVDVGTDRLFWVGIVASI